MIATKPTIDFERLATRKTVLFVTVSPVNPALHCLVNMFYAQAFKQLFEYAESREDSRLPRPVHVICDDFATGSRILYFPEHISIFREKDIPATILLQSQTQLEQMYGAYNATTILNNCDSYVYLGGMDLKTAQDISLRLNIPLDEVLYMPVGREYVFRRGMRPITTTRYDVRKHPVYQKMEEHAVRRHAPEEDEAAPDTMKKKQAYGPEHTGGKMQER